MVVFDVDKVAVVGGIVLCVVGVILFSVGVSKWKSSRKESVILASPKRILCSFYKPCIPRG